MCSNSEDVILIKCPEYFLLITLFAGVIIITVSGILYTILCANCCRVPVVKIADSESKEPARRVSVKQGHGFYASPSDLTAIVMEDGYSAHQNIARPPGASTYEANAVEHGTEDSLDNNYDDYYNNTYTGVVHVACESCGANKNHLNTIQSISGDFTFSSHLEIDVDADACMF